MIQSVCHPRTQRARKSEHTSSQGAVGRAPFHLASNSRIARVASLILCEVTSVRPCSSQSATVSSLASNRFRGGRSSNWPDATRLHWLLAPFQLALPQSHWTHFVFGAVIGSFVLPGISNPCSGNARLQMEGLPQAAEPGRFCGLLRSLLVHQLTPR